MNGFDKSITCPSLNAQFVSNGDGRRVKSVVNGETILFAGGHYEQKGSEITKYYFAGAQRIAIRKYTVPQTATLTYLVGDHLGSTSLAVNASTGEVIETRYRPWGEVRWTTENKSLPTRYTFTGQYSYVSDSATDLGAAGFGLMFYNARWYDPTIGRFAQADTVVPGGVQGFDRYAYVNNSPVNYTDPSGHAQYRSDYQNQIHARKMGEVYEPRKSERFHGSCYESMNDGTCITEEEAVETILKEIYGWIVIGNWSLAELNLLLEVAGDIEKAVGSVGVMREMFAPDDLNVYFMKEVGFAGRTGHLGEADKMFITLDEDWEKQPLGTAKFVVAHELGHVWDYRSGWKLSRGLQEEVGSTYPRYLQGRNGFVIYYGSSGNGPGATGWPRANDPNWDTWGEANDWNRIEDFAQSFAAYVYPQVAYDRYNKRYGLPPYQDFRDTTRGQYIEDNIPTP